MRRKKTQKTSNQKEVSQNTREKFFFCRHEYAYYKKRQTMRQFNTKFFEQHTKKYHQALADLKYIEETLKDFLEAPNAKDDTATRGIYASLRDYRKHVLDAVQKERAELVHLAQFDKSY